MGIFEDYILLREKRLMMNRPLRLRTSTMAVSTTAAAYARSCTSNWGALSWKNTLNGSEAVY